MAEERDATAVSGGDTWKFMWNSIVVVGIAAVGALVFGFKSCNDLGNVRQELAAKADIAEVARQIARLDSAKANIADLDSARMSIGTLTRVATTLNIRVVQAEKNLDKNRRATAAAASSAKKARELAQKAGDQLAQLDAENKAWQASTAGAIAGIPREIDSRVGPVAADLSSFQRTQAAARTAQDSVNAVHTAAINAFRAKLRLSDKDMARLAAELEKREQRRRGR